jgi:hypothetical protein
VERFIRYLRESCRVPLSSRLAGDGLVVDRETTNLAVKRWLREVANARIHGTTGAIPAERLVSKTLQLQSVPPYGGRAVRALEETPEPAPIIGMQPAVAVRCVRRRRAASDLQHQRLAELARELRLSVIPALYSAISQSAAAKSASFADFLEAVLLPLYAHV